MFSFFKKIDKVFFVFLFTTNLLFAENISTWTGGGDGSSWNDGSNWSNGVPNSSDVTATFDSSVSKVNIWVSGSYEVFGFDFSSAYEVVLRPNGDSDEFIVHNFISSIDSGLCEILVDLKLYGDVTFTESASYSFPLRGFVSDYSDDIPGKLIKQGGGELDLYKANTYSGGLEIQEGMVRNEIENCFTENYAVTINEGASLWVNESSSIGDLNGEGTVKLGSTLTINGSGEFSGLVEDEAYSGVLIIASDDTVTLSGNNIYTGETIINKGTLIVNSSLNTTSGITVNGGIISAASTSNMSHLVVNSGSVCGEGTYDGIDLNGGSISPGNSVGTINVNGNYNQASGAAYVVEISNTGNDQIIVSGNAIIAEGALLQITPSSYLVEGSSYDILTASDIVGDVLWSDVNLSKYFNLTLINDGTNDIARLTLHKTYTFPSRYIQPGNPTCVKDYLEKLKFWTDLDFDVVLAKMWFLDDCKLNEALNKMHPALFSAFELVNSDNNVLISSILSSQVNRNLCCDDRCCDTSFNLWTTPFGFSSNLDEYQSLIGYSSAGGGVAIGGDRCFGKNTVLGATCGYSGLRLNWKDSRGKTDIDKVFAGLYGGLLNDYLNIDFSTFAGKSFYDVDREFNITGLSRKASNEHSDFFVNSRVGVDFGRFINKEKKDSFISVFCKGDYSYLHQPDYKEKGADSLNLKVYKKNSQIMQTELGGKIVKSLKTQNDCKSGYFSLGWVRKFRLDDEYYKARLVDFKDEKVDLKVETFSSSKNFLSTELGASYRRKDFDFSLFYRGQFTEFSSVYLVNEFRATLRWFF